MVDADDMEFETTLAQAAECEQDKSLEDLAMAAAMLPGLVEKIEINDNSKTIVLHLARFHTGARAAIAALAKIGLVGHPQDGTHDGVLTAKGAAVDRALGLAHAIKMATNERTIEILFRELFPRLASKAGDAQFPFTAVIQREFAVARWRDLAHFQQMEKLPLNKRGFFPCNPSWERFADQARAALATDDFFEMLTYLYTFQVHIDPYATESSYSHARGHLMTSNVRGDQQAFCSVFNELHNSVKTTLYARKGAFEKSRRVYT